MMQDILSVATRQNFKRWKTLSEKSFYHHLSIIIFTVEDRKFSKKKKIYLIAIFQSDFDLCFDLPQFHLLLYHIDFIEFNK